MTTSKQPLLDHLHDDLPQWLAEQGQPRFRHGQIVRWVFERRAKSFDEMSDLPKTLRQALDEHYTLFSAQVAHHTTSADGTEKLLLQWPDGHRIESVLLRAKDGRRTICISTQVGCAMGCVFCASGLNGVARNLTSGEISEQMCRLNNLLDADERLSHIVVMGMGESLANLPNLFPALENATERLGIGARRITISTVGLPPGIRKLAQAGKAYHLAVSLHAPTDELRNQLVPVNDKIGLAAILDAADEYFAITGRRVTYEYVLLAGINDGRDHARQLGQLLTGRQALVNLIPYNPVSGLPYRTPSREAVASFVSTLEQFHVQTKVRHRKGADIDAACGQLRRRVEAQGVTLEV